MDHQIGNGPDDPRYAIRFAGHLHPRWAARFHGMTLTPLGDGTSLLEGTVIDQAGLHGVLAILRDLGLPLISLHHLADGEPPCATPPPRPDRRLT